MENGENCDQFLPETQAANTFHTSPETANGKEAQQIQSGHLVLLSLATTIGEENAKKLEEQTIVPKEGTLTLPILAENVDFKKADFKLPPMHQNLLQISPSKIDLILRITQNREREEDSFEHESEVRGEEIDINSLKEYSSERYGLPTNIFKLNQGENRIKLDRILINGKEW